MKEKLAEAHEEGGKIFLNGWFRWLIGITLTLLISSNAAATGYLYTSVLPRITDAIIKNDEKQTSLYIKTQEQLGDNRVAVARLEAKIDAVLENVRELNGVNRRSTPYERREDSVKNR